MARAGPPSSSTAPVQAGSIGELFWRVEEAVALVDGDRIIAWNPAAKARFGVSPRPGARVADVFAPLLGSGYAALLSVLEQTGTAVVDAMVPSGLVLDVKSWPIEGSDVRILILTDVTPARRLADGLRRFSVLVRNLLVDEPNLPDLLAQLVDEAKSVTGADYSTVLLFDEDSEVVTHFVYNAPRELFPERLPRAIGLLAAPIKAREAIVLDDIRGHPDGVGIPVHHAPIAALLAAPLLAGDAIIGEIAVANAPTGRGFDDVDTQLLTDLAAHAGIAVRWAESRERARVEHEFRREIIATARHDVRNPLMIGKGYVSILRAKRPRMDDEQVAAALDAVGSAFDRIEGFVFRALTDEQTEPAAERPHWTPIGVVALLDALAADHTAVATQSGTKVATSCDVGTPKEFFGDGGMVREVLDNLITNAIKYGAPGGVIKVTARPEGDHVRFDVNNSGDGISLDDQQRIFDPYWRTDSARASTVTGTGLGLSIVRRLVTLHGGVVGVTSRPDDGTTIWVTFPVSPRHDGSA